MGIEADVKELATDMGRAVGTAGHEAARTYIVKRLENIGVQPYLQQGLEAGYQGDGDALYNLGPSRYPEEDPNAVPRISATFWPCYQGKTPPLLPSF